MIIKNLAFSGIRYKTLERFCPRFIATGMRATTTMCMMTFLIKIA